MFFLSSDYAWTFVRLKSRRPQISVACGVFPTAHSFAPQTIRRPPPQKHAGAPLPRRRDAQVFLGGMQPHLRRRTEGNRREPAASRFRFKFVQLSFLGLWSPFEVKPGFGFLGLFLGGFWVAPFFGRPDFGWVFFRLYGLPALPRLGPGE